MNSWMTSRWSCFSRKHTDDHVTFLHVIHMNELYELLFTKWIDNLSVNFHSSTCSPINFFGLIYFWSYPLFTTIALLSVILNNIEGYLISTRASKYSVSCPVEYTTCGVFMCSWAFSTSASGLYYNYHTTLLHKVLTKTSTTKVIIFICTSCDSF